MSGSKRSNGEGSIIKRSDGTWTARLRLGTNSDGKRIVKAFYGKSRREVSNKLDEYKALYRRGESETNSSYFETYILYWLNNIKANELKPLSFDRLESTIKNHIIPAIGQYRINELSDSIIQTDLMNPKYSNGVLKYKNGWGIILMIFTGLRLGEAIALKWSDFDRENKRIKVRRNIALVKNRSSKGSKYNIIEQNTVKTDKSERSIPLSEKAVEALSHLEKNSSTYVMSTKDGNPIRPRNLQNLFDSMLKDTDISHKGLHATRHSFASMLFRMGADIKTVSELLGHTDIRITSNTYIHLIEKQKQSTIDLLDKVL